MTILTVLVRIKSVIGSGQVTSCPWPTRQSRNGPSQACAPQYTDRSCTLVLARQDGNRPCNNRLNSPLRMHLSRRRHGQAFPNPAARQPRATCRGPAQPALCLHHVQRLCRSWQGTSRSEAPATLESAVCDGSRLSGDSTASSAIRRSKFWQSQRRCSLDIVARTAEDSPFRPLQSRPQPHCQRRPERRCAGVEGQSGLAGGPGPSCAFCRLRAPFQLTAEKLPASAQKPLPRCLLNSGRIDYSQYPPPKTPGCQKEIFSLLIKPSQSPTSCLRREVDADAFWI